MTISVMNFNQNSCTATIFVLPFNSTHNFSTFHLWQVKKGKKSRKVKSKLADVKFMSQCRSHRSRGRLISCIFHLLYYYDQSFTGDALRTLFTGKAFTHVVQV